MNALCYVCGNELLSNYCTSNICESCCKSMKCPIRYMCQAYSKVLEGIIKDMNNVTSKEIVSGKRFIYKK